MFTGIVQTKLSVRHFERNDFGARLELTRTGWTPAGGYEPAPGDSIAINGICLTVVETTPACLSFDIIAETLRCTTLGSLAPNDAVNIEPALMPNQPLGGHFMQGHVDGLGTVKNVLEGSDEWRITIQPTDARMMDYITTKGSIAIDGVSLTIASVTTDTFDVALIPTTLELTTLAQLQSNDQVNLETDMIARSVVNVLKRWQGGDVPSRQTDKPTADPVTWTLLRKAGFVND